MRAGLSIMTLQSAGMTRLTHFIVAKKLVVNILTPSHEITLVSKVFCQF
jgi:hypothetical protein